MATTLREDGFVVNNKDNKLEMTVEPVKVAQDIFVAELAYMYELFKSIFSGDDFSSNIISSAMSVAKYAYDKFLNPYITITKTLLSYCSKWADVAKINNSETSDNSSNSSSSSGTISTSKSNITINNTGGTNPVIIIDFSLDETVLTHTKSIADTKQKIVEIMKSVNEKMNSIKVLAYSDAENANLKKINDIEKIVATNTNAITTHKGRIENIEEYLEKTDNDGTDDEAIKFSLRDIP